MSTPQPQRSGENEEEMFDFAVTQRQRDRRDSRNENMNNDNDDNNNDNDNVAISGVVTSSSIRRTTTRGSSSGTTMNMTNRRRGVANDSAINTRSRTAGRRDLRSSTNTTTTTSPSPSISTSTSTHPPTSYLYSHLTSYIRSSDASASEARYILRTATEELSRHFPLAAMTPSWWEVTEPSSPTSPATTSQPLPPLPSRSLSTDLLNHRLWGRPSSRPSYIYNNHTTTTTTFSPPVAVAAAVQQAAQQTSPPAAALPTSSSPAVQSRPRPRQVTRSTRRGRCVPCIVQHRVCNGARPTCDRCARIGRTCEYPQPGITHTEVERRHLERMRR